MTETVIQFSEYKDWDWLKEVKERIHKARIKAALAANTDLITFYW